jgi:hypothetical protein
MDLGFGLRGYGNLVKVLKNQVKTVPPRVTELDFTPGSFAQPGALTGVHVVVFYAQDYCPLQLTEADRAAIASFTKAGGLVITIGDWYNRQTDAKNAEVCHLGAGEKDAVAYMYSTVFGWDGMRQSTDSINGAFTTKYPFAKNVDAAKGTVFASAEAPSQLSGTVTYYAGLLIAPAAKVHALGILMLK